MPTHNIPTDVFSRRRRELQENPGVLHATSTVHLTDFLGNFENWVIDTFRVDGQETLFLIISEADGGRRLMIPPQIAAVIYRQRDQLIARMRKVAARQAVATKREAGVRIGNPEALARARKGRRKKS